MGWSPYHILLLGFLLLNITIGRGQTPFTDVTEAAGIDHEFKVYEGLLGGGATVFDLNNDGFEDLYITSGMKDDALYLNKGDGTFQNIYNKSGLGITKKYVTQGVTSADVNRDGFKDLFITTITSKDSAQIIPRAKNLLFLNNGDMTFRDVTTEFGLDEFYSYSTGASFGDVNADGFPDIYVGNYFIEYDGPLSAINASTIVGANQTAKGYLLINHEGNTFKNEYGKYGLTFKGFGFGALFTDFDNDGDQDLYVNHDFGYKAFPNFLMENLYPNKWFKDISQETGMDLKINSMGSAVGDYDNNGFLDYYVTNIRFNHLMVNQGPKHPFLDKTKEVGLFTAAISWGANFADFDQDGDLDLYVSNGDLNPNCSPIGNFYFENEDGKFTEKGRYMGVNDYGIGRGSVVFDMDNDGDLDLLVVNQIPVKEYPVTSNTRLFRNDLAKGNWLKVALEGTEADKNGIGSRVEIVTGGIHMIREIDGGGSSHLSQNSTIAHFGLGTSTRVDSVIVTWVGGKKQLVLNQKVNQLLLIKEIKGAHKNSWLIFLFSGFAMLGITAYLFSRNKKAKNR